MAIASAGAAAAAGAAGAGAAVAVDVQDAEGGLALAGVIAHTGQLHLGGAGLLVVGILHLEVGVLLQGVRAEAQRDLGLDGLAGVALVADGDQAHVGAVDGLRLDLEVGLAHLHGVVCAGIDGALDDLVLAHVLADLTAQPPGDGVAGEQALDLAGEIGGIRRAVDLLLALGGGDGQRLGRDRGRDADALVAIAAGVVAADGEADGDGALAHIRAVVGRLDGGDAHGGVALLGVADLEIGALQRDVAGLVVDLGQRSALVGDGQVGDHELLLRAADGADAGFIHVLVGEAALLALGGGVLSPGAAAADDRAVVGHGAVIGDGAVVGQRALLRQGQRRALDDGDAVLLAHGVIAIQRQRAGVDDDVVDARGQLHAVGGLRAVLRGHGVIHGVLGAHGGIQIGAQGEVLQRRVVQRGVRAQGLQGIRDDQGLQRDAALEGIVADGLQALGQLDLGQGLLILEGRGLDVRDLRAFDRLGHHDLGGSGGREGDDRRQVLLVQPVAKDAGLVGIDARGHVQREGGHRHALRHGVGGVLRQRGGEHERAVIGRVVICAGPGHGGLGGGAVGQDHVQLRGQLGQLRRDGGLVGQVLAGRRQGLELGDRHGLGRDGRRGVDGLVGRVSGHVRQRGLPTGEGIGVGLVRGLDGGLGLGDARRRGAVGILGGLLQHGRAVRIHKGDGAGLAGLGVGRLVGGVAGHVRDGGLPGGEGDDIMVVRLVRHGGRGDARRRGAVGILCGAQDRGAVGIHEGHGAGLAGLGVGGLVGRSAGHVRQGGLPGREGVGVVLVRLVRHGGRGDTRRRGAVGIGGLAQGGGAVLVHELHGEGLAGLIIGSGVFGVAGHRRDGGRPAREGVGVMLVLGLGGVGVARGRAVFRRRGVDDAAVVVLPGDGVAALGGVKLRGIGGIRGHVRDLGIPAGEGIAVLRRGLLGGVRRLGDVPGLGAVIIGLGAELRALGDELHRILVDRPLGGVGDVRAVLGLGPAVEGVALPLRGAFRVLGAGLRGGFGGVVLAVAEDPGVVVGRRIRRGISPAPLGQDRQRRRQQRQTHDYCQPQYSDAMLSVHM